MKNQQENLHASRDDGRWRPCSPPAAAHAQTYPDKPIHVIVPFTPGSATDVIGARAVPGTVEQARPAGRGREQVPAPAARIGAAQVAKRGARRLYAAGPLVRPHRQSLDLSPISATTRRRTWWASACWPSCPTSWSCRRARDGRPRADLVKAAKAAAGQADLRLGRRRQRHPHERREVPPARRHRRPCISPTRDTPEALTDIMGGRIDYFFAPVSPRCSLVRDKRRDGAGRGQRKALVRPARRADHARKPAIRAAPTISGWACWRPPARRRRWSNASTPRSRRDLGHARGQGTAGGGRRRCGAEHVRRLRQADRARTQGECRAGEGSRHQGAVRVIMADALLQTTVVGSYPQPDWLVNREMLSQGRAAHARCGDLARARALPRAGAGRRHPARHPRHGAGRHRHHHRRRDAARELLQPLRHGARGHRRRAIPAEIVNNASARRRRCRAWSARSGARGPVEVRDMQFLRANTDAAGQDHPARPLHHEPAGEGRVLQGRRGDGAWTTPPR